MPPAPYRSWGGEVTSSAFRAGIASCLSGASQSYRLLGKPGKEPENDTGRFPRTGEHQGDMSSPPSTIEFSLFFGGTASYYAVLGRYASSGITIRMPLLVLMWGKECLTIKSLAMKIAPGVKEAYLAVGKSHLYQQMANGEEHVICIAFSLSGSRHVRSCLERLNYIFPAAE